MAKRASTIRIAPSKVSTLKLAERIADEVTGWRNQGYHPLPSHTTHQLLLHWFDESQEPGFHPCQRLAIETIIYLHEVAGCRTLRDVYDKFAPEQLNLFKTIADEVDSIPFAKYCIKSATGSGKTWVLAALVVWQYFNAINDESNAPYSPRFMVVTPGLEVRNRILDSFKGPKDPRTGNREPSKADYRRPLFMPEDAQWRGRFNLLDVVLEPSDLRANTSPPDGPFVAISNWQQFVLAKDAEKLSLAEQLGLEIPEEPQGEVIADFMTTYPDLVILNDEAHHVHGKKTARADELVWRRFMTLLHGRMAERHGRDRGLFLQLDFSATPFYGSGNRREYFPHIVYDYDLRDALNDMLVKQLFLEERTKSAGQTALRDLEVRAVRDDERKAVRLAPDQKQILAIAVSKLNQLAGDFKNKGLRRKPVLMVLCEDTSVADMVHDHLAAAADVDGKLFGPSGVLAFHSNLTRERHGYTLDEARGATVVPDRSHPTLADIDDDDHPLRIVVSVLALREGFDKTNICVIAALRSTEADMLLEQVVGRGLRLMFPRYKVDQTLWTAKEQAFADLKSRKQPHNSLDFLYIVEHPRFRTFYDELRKEGYLIAAGDSSQTTPTGDLKPVDAAPGRIPDCDLAWPVAIQEEAKLPDLSQVDVASLPSGTWQIDAVRKAMMQSDSITDRHLETDTRAATWSLRDRHFDYNHFLATTANAIAGAGRKQVLTGKRADIAALVDAYVSTRLFRESVDFSDEHNYVVLAHDPIRNHVIEMLRNVINELLGQISYEVRAGQWRRLSDLARVLVREHAAVETYRCIYPYLPVASRFGGLERDVMETTLDGSPEVLAWCKLQKRHNLTIPYRDENGLMRTYEVDFICRTAERCYLLETKSTKDLETPNVAVKARAADQWCRSVSGVRPPVGADQPDQWEYLLLDQDTYAANTGASFTALLPLMRQVRDQVIAEQFKGELFG